MNKYYSNAIVHKIFIGKSKKNHVRIGIGLMFSAPSDKERLASKRVSEIIKLCCDASRLTVSSLFKQSFVNSH